MHGCRVETGELQRQIPGALSWIRIRFSGELIGGFVLGHGERDIDTSVSALHGRAEFGSAKLDRLVTPMNFKFTTAPLAAARAVEAIESDRAQRAS